MHAMTPTKEHIILFPYLAQGHFISFMSLAATLHHRNPCSTITFVTTPANVHNLRPTIPPNSSICLAALPFHGPDHGLPPNKESADLLEFPLSLRLFQAYQTLKPAFQNLVLDITKKDSRPPLAIISDIFSGWTVDIAKQLGIFQAVFISSGAYGTAVYFSLYLNLPHLKTDSDEFLLPDFPEPVLLHRSQMDKEFFQQADDENDDGWLTTSLQADGFLFNTLEELEKAGLEYFRKKTNRPAWGIGPLKNIRHARKQPGISVDSCISWLDLHPPSSVLYISFGSENTMSASQMKDLAMVLESIGKPFIWVIRPPSGFSTNEEFRGEWLPEGFEERVREKKQGILVRRWAPQLEILSHASTSTFLSHCGWNSTLESLSRGVPLIGWPLAAEQFYTVKMMEELGVCVEIARGDGREIERDEAGRVIEMVMGKKGEEMRRKALQVKEMMELAVKEDEEFPGSSMKALDEFLRTISRKKENQHPKLEK
ncbi:hypothetical protein ACLOJK_037639 [Asimina triloba]